MTDKNDQRLLSSVRSAVTPRQHRRPSLPQVSRHRSTKKHVHGRKTHSAKSTTIIHTKIRQFNNSASANEDKNVDTFPSIMDLVNATDRRRKSTSIPNHTLNESSNSTTQSSIHSRRKLKSQLTKSSKVVPSNAFHNSIQFNSSTQTTIINEGTGRKRSIDNLHDVMERTHKRRKKSRRFCCAWWPCILGLLFASFVLGVILTALLLEFLPKSATTKSNISMTSGSSGSTTTPTTTTHTICGSSCVNQSWVSSINLLASWQFDNNLLEDVNNSLASAAQTATYVTGYVNQALSFDATAGQILRTSTISLMATSFTIDGWIYPTGFPNLLDHSIIGLCPKDSIYECLYLTVHEDSGNYYLYFGFFGDDCEGNTIISLNEWIHVAFVFDMTSSRFTQNIYLNGKLDATRVTAGSFQGSADVVTIGDVPEIDSDFGSNYFEGWIDRLSISNRVKSECEILEEATLSAHFTFDLSSSMTDSGPNSLSAVGSSVSFIYTGHPLQAISFAGTAASYLQISDVTSLGITNRPFSISLWIRPNVLSGILVYVSANASGLGWCTPFLGFAANGSIVAQMYNTGIRSVIGPSIPVASQWTHIVETWSSPNGLRLYVNNVLVASTISMANSYTASTVPNYVTLGNSLSGAGICNAGLLGSMNPYNGDMDDFRIYSRELTTADICTLFIN